MVIDKGLSSHKLILNINITACTIVYTQHIHDNTKLNTFNNEAYPSLAEEKSDYIQYIHIHSLDQRISALNWSANY